MTSEVIDTVPLGGVSCCHRNDTLEDSMTAVTASVARTTEDRLRSVLRLDAVVTGLVGAFAFLGDTSRYGDVPGWLPRAAGVVLLIVAVDLAIAARWSGNRLRLAGLVCSELAFGWVVATLAVLAFVEVPSSGTEILLLVGAATLGFAIAELRLVRRLSASV